MSGENSNGVLLGTKSNPTTVTDSPVTDPGSVVKVSFFVVKQQLINFCVPSA